MAKDIKRATLRAIAKRFESDGLEYPQKLQRRKDDVIWIYNASGSAFKVGESVTITDFCTKLQFSVAKRRMYCKNLTLKATREDTNDPSLLATTIDDILPNHIGRARKTDVEFAIVKFKTKVETVELEDGTTMKVDTGKPNLSHQFATSDLVSSDESDVYRILAKSEPYEKSCVCALSRLANANYVVRLPLVEVVKDGVRELRSGMYWENVNGKQAWDDYEGAYPNSCHVRAGNGIKFTDGGDCSHGAKDNRIIQIEASDSGEYELVKKDVKVAIGAITNTISVPSFTTFPVSNPLDDANKKKGDVIVSAPNIVTKSVKPIISCDSFVSAITDIEATTVQFPEPTYADIPIGYTGISETLDVSVDKTTDNVLKSLPQLQYSDVNQIEVVTNVSLNPNGSDISITYVSGVSCGPDGTIQAEYSTLTFGLNVDKSTVNVLSNSNGVVTGFDGDGQTTPVLTDVQFNSGQKFLTRIIPFGTSKKVVTATNLTGKYATDVLIKDRATCIGQGIDIIPFDISTLEGDFKTDEFLKDITSTTTYIQADQGTEIAVRSSTEQKVVTDLQYETYSFGTELKKKEPPEENTDTDPNKDPNNPDTNSENNPDNPNTDSNDSTNGDNT